MERNTGVFMKACGDCDICCRGFVHVKVFTHQIDLGNPCPYVQNGCKVHRDRPAVCRDFQCSWKVEEWDDSMIPADSGAITQYREHEGRTVLLATPTVEDRIPARSLDYIKARCIENDYGLIYSERVPGGSMIMGFNDTDVDMMT